MLDRSKLIREVSTLSNTLFFNFASEYSIARQVWDTIKQDSALAYKVRNAHSDLLVPYWEGSLEQAIPIKTIDSYTVVSVDGSQIYPDKHQGTPCYLINIGEVVLDYQDAKKPVSLNSEPYLFNGNEPSTDSVTELVNNQRQAYEFKAGLELSAKKYNEHNKNSFVFLFDGSLIFWHLENKEAKSRSEYLARYLAYLEQFYQLRIPMAGYISLPKSRELSNIVRLALCNFDMSSSDDYTLIEHFVDAIMVQFFLQPQTRTIVFKNQSSITDYYPDHLKPYFFYMHVGNEIGRVEIPAWIAHNESQVNTVASLIFDQALKGAGYPVAVAEAHEQAVIKGADREFFYQLISKTALEQKRRIMQSQKSIKKRGLRI